MFQVLFKIHSPTEQNLVPVTILHCNINMKYRIIFILFLVAMIMTIKTEGRVFQRNSQFSESTDSPSQSNSSSLEVDTSENESSTLPSYKREDVNDEDDYLGYRSEAGINTPNPQNITETGEGAKWNGLGYNSGGKYKLIFFPIFMRFI